MHFLFFSGHYKQFHVTRKAGHCLGTQQACICDLKVPIVTVIEVIGHFLFKGDVHGTTLYGNDYAPSHVP
jgi:hypothetical protein